MTKFQKDEKSGNPSGIGKSSFRNFRQFPKNPKKRIIGCFWIKIGNFQLFFHVTLE